MAGTILAIVVLGLMLLGALAVAVVILLVVGGALFEARSHAPLPPGTGGKKP